MTTEKLKRGDLRDALIDYADAATKAGTIATMSLRAAARDLGVSSGAVYRHFDDKDALLSEITHRGFLELRQVFRAIRPEDAPATSVDQAMHRSRELVRTYIQFAHDNPTLWNMMFGPIGVANRDRLMADEEHRHYTPFDVTLENLRDLWRLGALDHEPDLDDVRYIWSATHGAASLTISQNRLDFAEIDAIAEQTADRNIRAMGLKKG
ncbi:MAG: TetR/AcrR family transcriptional regulator [Pseudomonadota bacterium]